MPTTTVGHALNRVAIEHCLAVNFVFAQPAADFDDDCPLVPEAELVLRA